HRSVVRTGTFGGGSAQVRKPLAYHVLQRRRIRNAVCLSQRRGQLLIDADDNVGCLQQGCPLQWTQGGPQRRQLLRWENTLHPIIACCLSSKNRGEARQINTAEAQCLETTKRRPELPAGKGGKKVMGEVMPEPGDELAQPLYLLVRIGMNL